MSSELNTIGLEERMGYLQQISENQRANTQKFHWGTAIVSFIVGACIAAYGINKYQTNKEKKGVPK